MEMILGGDPVSAEEMHRHGVVAKVAAEGEEVRDLATKLATAVAGWSAPAVALAKQAIQAGRRTPIAAHYASLPHIRPCR